MTRHCCVLVVLLAATVVGRADDWKPEPGFTMLFPAKTLDGWNTKTGESLAGKSEAFKGRFKLTDAVLEIDPKVKGDVIIQTVKEFGAKVHLKFDFLPGAGCNNDLYLHGLKFDLKKGDVKNMKEGEWNQFEILIQNGQAEFRCNGQTLKTQKTKSSSSPFGIRAEFGPMQIRRLRVQAD